jgi:hypothetical protein
MPFDAVATISDVMEYQVLIPTLLLAEKDEWKTDTSAL